MHVGRPLESFIRPCIYIFSPTQWGKKSSHHDWTTFGSPKINRSWCEDFCRPSKPCTSWLLMHVKHPWESFTRPCIYSFSTSVQTQRVQKSSHHDWTISSSPKNKPIVSWGVFPPWSPCMLWLFIHAKRLFENFIKPHIYFFPTSLWTQRAEDFFMIQTFLPKCTFESYYKLVETNIAHSISRCNELILKSQLFEDWTTLHILISQNNHMLLKTIQIR